MFKAAAERRTLGRTGVLIYLSMAERRAEIVADEAILKVTDAAHLGRGDGGAARAVEARAARPTGSVAAIERVGVGAGRAFPAFRRTTRNEIPDKLIEL